MFYNYIRNVFFSDRFQSSAIGNTVRYPKLKVLDIWKNFIGITPTQKRQRRPYYNLGNVYAILKEIEGFCQLGTKGDSRRYRY